MNRPRKPKRETTLHQAQQLMLSPAPSLDEVRQVDQALREVLTDMNPFWIRWGFFIEKVNGGRQFYDAH